METTECVGMLKYGPLDVSELVSSPR